MKIFSFDDSQHRALNTALMEFIWSLERSYCKTVSDPLRQEYVTRLRERIDYYREFYKYLNDGAELIYV